MPAVRPSLPLRVLLVDDHHESLRSLARLLRHEGHTVITAHSVAGALALVSGQQPVDLLISDVGLPDGDGCKLLARLRQSYGGKEIPAIALSGHGDAHWIDECRRAGYRTFLLKPVKFDQVLSATAALVGPLSPAPRQPPGLPGSTP
jgi:CheY-like chemotaxis protein